MPDETRKERRAPQVLATLAGVLAAFLLSLGIELLQPLLTTHRTADITDLIANTVGGLAGYLLFLPFAGPLLRLCREP